MKELEYWSSERPGVLEQWSTGVLKELEYWSTGVMEYRSNGALD